MVERLKSAIEKARAQRTGAPMPPSGARTQAARAPLSPLGAPTDWSAYPELELDLKRLERERIISRDKSDPAYRAFDMLRTRTIRTSKEKGWSRIALTSPTKGVGKTVVAINLAFSLARQPDTRVLLVDFDLVSPRLSEVLAPKGDVSIEAFLRCETTPENYFRRYGENLIFGLNHTRVLNSAELLQSVDTAARLNETLEYTRPTIVLYDLPPVMASDDALSVLANVDCALLVAGAGQTVAREVIESERLISEWTNLLGVVLNKSEETSKDYYGY